MLNKKAADLLPERRFKFLFPIRTRLKELSWRTSPSEQACLGQRVLGGLLDTQAMADDVVGFIFRLHVDIFGSLGRQSHDITASRVAIRIVFHGAGAPVELFERVHGLFPLLSVQLKY